MRRQTPFVALLVLAFAAGWAQEQGPSHVELNKLPFFYGREYFVLRSGRAQMILQADRADLGPAFTFLLFDAQNSRQSRSKDGAFNFAPSQGFESSALQVILRGYPFTALGHRTETRWVLTEGIPAVEAVWWAGGIRVTEQIAALERNHQAGSRRCFAPAAHLFRRHHQSAPLRHLEFIAAFADEARLCTYA